MNWLDKQIAIIFDWWRKRKLMRDPYLAEYARQEREARRKHKAVKPLQKARSERMTVLLREGR